MRIYLSGIENSADLSCAISWGADAIGIRTGNRSGLHPEKARDLFLQIPLFISRVGIFGEEKGYELQELISFCRLHAVHLSGGQKLSEVRGISEPLIHTLPVESWPQISHLTGQAVTVSLAEAAAACDLPLPDGVRLIISGRSTQEKMWSKAVERYQPHAIQLDIDSTNEEMVGWLRQL